MIIEPTISLNTEKEKVDNKPFKEMEARIKELEKQNKDLEKALEEALKNSKSLKEEDEEKQLPKTRRTAREV